MLVHVCVCACVNQKYGMTSPGAMTSVSSGTVLNYGILLLGQEFSRADPPAAQRFPLLPEVKKL